MNDPAQQVSDPNANQQIPQVPAATPHKEAEPVAISTQASAEFLKPSEVAPEISKEVAEAGVEAVSETPPVTPLHKQMGIEPAKESVPVQTQPSGAVQLPQSQEEAATLLKKNSDVRNSRTWWLTWFIRQFKISHSKEAKAQEEKAA